MDSQYKKQQVGSITLDNNIKIFLPQRYEIIFSCYLTDIMEKPVNIT